MNISSSQHPADIDGVCEDCGKLCRKNTEDEIPYFDDYRCAKCQADMYRYMEREKQSEPSAAERLSLLIRANIGRAASGNDLLNGATSDCCDGEITVSGVCLSCKEKATAMMECDECGDRITAMEFWDNACRCASCAKVYAGR